MITVTTPYPQFAELDGSPLDGGSVYIGTAGLNSETNPIAVFWDNAGTQPAAQPLRTRSGVIARNGAPARVYVNAAAYSLLVKDKQGRLIAYEASISSAVGTDNIDDGAITEVKLDTAVTDKINGALQRTGGTMTGALTLQGNAASALQAVTKQQLDEMTRSGLASLTVIASANTLVATLAAETINLRSTPLSNGASVARTAAAPAIMTVPTGATLGTANGVQARLVFGWLDNAGTLEPFVVNLTAGLSLDESTLINTTAISGTSNSASVFYSQTARTGVPFRVRGFCDVTQATAGTWATSPSLVQGAGGQAIVFGNRFQYSLTAVQPATGVAVDFNSIPNWAQRVTLVPREVSTNGTSRVQILFQTSAGYLVSGYRGAFVYAANGGGSIGGNVANNFAMDAFAAASDLRNGAVQFSKAPGTNTWIQSGTVGLSNAAAVSTVGGSVPLPGPLTGLRVYTNSADVFDNGDFFLLIEG